MVPQVEPNTNAEEALVPKLAKRTRRPASKPASRSSATGRARNAEPGAALDPTPLIIAKPAMAERPIRKALTLGAEPTTPRGENCNIRDVLTASQDAQQAEFGALVGASRESGAYDEALTSAIMVLSRLNEDFGDDEQDRLSS